MTKFKARPTLYKGIQMRSRLEADYAAHLDKHGACWKYEPICFASNEGQWLPDFSYTADWGGTSPLTVFDEVKPAGSLMEYKFFPSEFTEHVDPVLRRMTIAWESNPEACLRLVFWQYGGPWHLLVSSRCQGSPWVAGFDGQSRLLLWPGMGQDRRCRDAETTPRGEQQP